MQFGGRSLQCQGLGYTRFLSARRRNPRLERAEEITNAQLLELNCDVLIPAAILIRYPTQLARSVAKTELERVPFLGAFLKSYGSIFVNRTGRDLRGMRQIIQAMKTGKVVIYPEGTRSMDGKLLPGKRTVGRLIHLARPVVIPAAVWGTILAIPPTSPWPRVGKDLGVRFGPPLDMEPLYALPPTKENSQQIIDHVMSAIGGLVEEVKAEGRVVEI